MKPFIKIKLLVKPITVTPTILFTDCYLLAVLVAEPHRGDDPSSHGHKSLIVVLVITAVSILMAIAFFLYKKSPRSLPTFVNPLYFDSERSQPDVVDTNKLIENAVVENSEPIITL